MVMCNHTTHWYLVTIVSARCLTTEEVTCVGELEQNWKMSLTLEGWVRRVVGVREGEHSPRMRDHLPEFMWWLGCVCSAHLSGVQRIRGAAQPSGAELRMQLSALATMSKIGRLMPEAPNLFLHHLTDSLCTVMEADAGTGHLELHFISLYMACILGQPGMERRIFPIGLLDSVSSSPHGSPDPPTLAHNTLCLQINVGAWVTRAVQRASSNLEEQAAEPAAAIKLAEHAVALLTSGPLWSMLQAVLAVSLHPFCRLSSYCCTFGTPQALQILLDISRYVSDGLGLALQPSFSRGNSSSNTDAAEPDAGIALDLDLDLPSPREAPFSDTADPDAAHPASSARSDVGSAASQEEHQPASAEQRSMVLSCIAAANALLHSDALDLLFELWHMGISAGQPGSVESSSNQGIGESQEQHSVDSGNGESPGSCHDAGSELLTVSTLLKGLLFNTAVVLQHSYVIMCCDSAVSDGNLSASRADFERRLNSITFDELEGCSENPSTSFFDVPTQTQAEATQAGLSMLTQLRSLAAELLTMTSVALPQPDQQLDASSAAVQGYVGASWSQWEVLQAAMFRCLPPEQQEDWGHPLVCCNPGCTNLSGPSELQLKTYACGGGCRVR